MPDPAQTEQICRACGASHSRSSARCWLCGEPTFERPTVEPPPVVATEPAEPRTPPQFSLASLLLGITLICVALGLFGWQPGLGIGFAFLALPATVRAAGVTMRRRRARGAALGLGEKSLVLLNSLFVVACIIVAAGAAFYATCWVGFFGGATVAEAVGERGPYAGLGAGLMTGVISGIIAALVAIVFMTRWLWKGK